MWFYKKFGKRYVDVFFAFWGIVVLSPLFILIALLVKVSSKGPVLFKQQRVGRDFKVFNIYKFRSMFINAPSMGPSVTSSNDPRITRIGKILRKTKLDELPQLFNVLKGDMSFIGPRPEVQKFVDYAADSYKNILLIRPGITDYAAVKFSKEEEILSRYEDKERAYKKHVLPTKIDLYKKYISDFGIFTDILILLSTIIKIMPLKIDLLHYITVEVPQDEALQPLRFKFRNAYKFNRFYGLNDVKNSMETIFNEPVLSTGNKAEDRYTGTNSARVQAVDFIELHNDFDRIANIKARS